MQKGIRFVTAVILTGSLFGFSDQTAGQGKESLEISQKSLYLIQKDLPPTFTLQREEKEAKTGNMEATTTSKPKPNYTELTVEATAYVSFCDTGCTGITATGTNVQKDIYHESGLPIIAVDPAVIPLGSTVEIDGRKYIADDTGGAIQGNRIDILVSVRNTSKAFNYGRRNIEIKVYK